MTDAVQSGDDADLQVAREVLDRYDGGLTVDRRTSRPRFVLTLPVADSER